MLSKSWIHNSRYTQSLEQCYTADNTFIVSFLACLALSFALFVWGTDSRRGPYILDHFGGPVLT